MRNKKEIYLRYIETMLSMQYQLDLKLLGDDMFEETKIKKRKLAFCVEVGEMLNERADLFKYWKKQISIDNEKALGEWVDVWHFALSLFIYSKRYQNGREMIGVNRKKIILQDVKNLRYPIEDALFDLFTHVHSLKGESLISTMICVGDMIGFSMDDIFDAYVKKNGVNVQRFENGY